MSSAGGAHHAYNVSNAFLYDTISKEQGVATPCSNWAGAPKSTKAVMFIPFRHEAFGAPLHIPS